MKPRRCCSEQSTRTWKSSRKRLNCTLTWIKFPIGRKINTRITIINCWSPKILSCSIDQWCFRIRCNDRSCRSIYLIHLIVGSNVYKTIIIRTSWNRNIQYILPRQCYWTQKSSCIIIINPNLTLATTSGYVC